MDVLYVFAAFENKLAQSLSAMHPSQLLFNTSGLGLSNAITLLKQNYSTIESFLEDDPDDSAYYEEIS
jgi:hypothetical protein